MVDHLYLMSTMNDPLKIEVSAQKVAANDIAIFGCSFSDLDTKCISRGEVYGSLLGNYFNKNVLNFAKGGKGNYRSFDLIGQTDFESGSILILQLTELSRIRWYTTEIQDLMMSVGTPPRELIHTFHDRFLIYDLIRQLRIIVELCRSKKVRLVIWSIAKLFDDELNNIIEYYLHKFPEYIYINPEYRVDNGQDGINQPIGNGHPGPKSHAIIAQVIIKHFESLYK